MSTLYLNSGFNDADWLEMAGVESLFAPFSPIPRLSPPDYSQPYSDEAFNESREREFEKAGNCLLWSEM